MRNIVNIMGIPVDKVTMEDAVDNLDTFLGEDRMHIIYTPNAEIMMDALKNPLLSKALCEADMVIPDGAGVVLAARILGNRLPEKVPGFDLLKNSFSLGNPKRNLKYFFFGGKPGVAEEAAISVLSQHKNIQVVGYRNGYFSKDDENDIIEEINNSGADILAVALGAPKQEIWIHENRSRLKARVCIGVGGSFDVFAGKVQLAPEFYRKNGLEWLYRLCKEPWRYKRMLKLPRFILRTFAYKLGLFK